MKAQHKTIILALGLGAAVWIFDAALDSLFFYETSFWDSLVADVYLHELYMRSSFLIAFIIFGFILAGVVKKRAKALETIQERDERIDHLNLVLRAIRNVNQLIVKERDPVELIKKSCENLTETRGYFNAWIVLFDDEGKYKASAESGLGDKFLRMEKFLKRGGLTTCGRKCLDIDETIVVENPLVECKDCPLADSYSGRSGITSRLECGGKIFGLLAVSVQSRFADDDEERGLVKEVADDIAFALHKIGAEAEIHLFKYIVSKSPQPISFVSRKYRYIAVNDIYAKLYGVEKKEIIGKTISDFFGEETFKSEIKPKLDRCLSGEIIKYELQANFPGRGLRWMRMDYSPYKDENDEIAGVVSQGLDITERKEAESKLLENRNMLRHVINSVPQFIFWKDINLVYIGCNENFARAAGVSKPEDIAGKTDFDLAWKIEEAEYFRKIDKDVIESGVPRYKILEPQLQADGKQAWLETNKIPLRDAEGIIVGILGSYEDVTDRIKAEERLRESEERYRAIFNNTAIGVGIRSLDDSYIKFNDYYHKMLGYSEEELAELKPSDITHPDDLNITRGALAEVKSGAASLRRYQKRYIRKDGEIIWGEVSIQGLKNANGKVFAVAGVVNDISDRKRAEDELVEAKERAEQSDRLKSAFLANMSHEIRTPMNGILGFANLLQDKSITGEEREEYIDLIEKSGLRMLNIINDLINISKIEAGEIKTSLQKYNLNLQIKDLYNFFKPEYDLKNIELKYYTPLTDEEAHINSDNEKVYAILTNLLKNAVKYTHKGTVEFGYKVEEKSIQFYVSDTGIGVPPEQLEAIFDRFVQSESGLDRAYEGAGLGLAISKSYVEMLGGRIWAESERGKGSKFYFSLPIESPLSKKETTSEEETDQSLAQVNLQNKTALIAEDDEISDLFLTKILRKKFKKIFHAKNGNDAVDICKKNSVDLILMDVKMPQMDGLTATRKIREFDTDVAIIAQSAYAGSDDREKALEAGCDAFTTKPVNKNVLMKMIIKLINKDAIDKKENISV